MSESSEERYHKIRDRYIGIQLNQVEQFDKNMLLLSSGTFGISFAFINQVVKNPSAANTAWMIIVAWSSMALCILNTLVSFLVSNYVNDREVLIIDIEEENKMTDCALKRVVPKNRLKRAPNIMNIGTLVMFACGMVFMIIYVANNVK